MHEIALEVVVDPLVPIPARGAVTPLELALRITNRSGTVLRFKELDTVRITMIAPDGTPMTIDGGRNATAARATVSGPVDPGGHLLIGRPARLTWTLDDRLRLIGDDGFGGIWHFDGLQPGVYRIRMTYENTDERVVNGVPLWTGVKSTADKEVRLR
ncbi:MAG TPA: hypothetical protein VKA21_17030 [Candidatus Binatia bacterium]|nr:hypothetical protein [Candidatus Binatia bacterium]